MATDLGRAALRYCWELLAPLTALADPDGLTDLLAEIGWDSQALGLTDPSVFATTVEGLETALDAVSQVLGEDAIELSGLGQALASLATAAASVVQVLTTLSLPASVPADVLAQLGTDLLNYLLAKHFVSSFPRLAVGASLLGFLSVSETAQVTDAGGGVLRQPTVQYSIDLTALDKALKDPLQYARTNLLADSTGARRAADAIADLIGPDLCTALGWTGLGAAYGVIPPDPTVTLTPAEQSAASHLMIAAAGPPEGGLAAPAALSLSAGLTDDTAGQGLGLLVAASGDVSLSIVLMNGTLTLTVGGALQPLVITGQSVQLATTDSGTATFSVDVKYATAVKPAVLLGSANNTGLQIDSLQVDVSVTEDSGSVDLNGSVSLAEVTLQVQADDGDGFISSVLPSNPIELQGDLGLEVGLRKGVRVHGAGALRWSAAINKSLGPVELNEIAAALVFADGAANFQLTATHGLALGPLSATIDATGIAAALQRPASAGSGPVCGNAGPYAFAVGFKAPDGAGLALDAGVATGGGFIECDAAKGQYAGVLALSLESLSLTAIGLIQTKNADGSPLPGGFSLLVVISVEFMPFIELGFGFSLNGVGGFLGLNRTMNKAALEAAVLGGSLGDLMFPADPVGHAPQLIQELAGFFPPAAGRFLIGPMVQIQWGSPLTILTADLGVIIELPAPVRVAILGVLQVGLPRADEDAIILLNLDVVGFVDFGLGTLSLQASLYGSRIAEFPVSGGMALQMGWKAEREFLISFGGYNPGQQPPPGFPSLDRLAICLSSSDTAAGGDSSPDSTGSSNSTLSLSLQAYFAVTSNTLQFGASAHLRAQIGGTGVVGMVSFDALIHKNPFGLQVNFAASVSVTFDGQQLLAVSLAGQLSGPAPWLISGQASISLLFISVSVSFQFPLGSAAVAALLGPVGVIGLLATDVGLAVNWSALPPAGDQVVTVSPAPSSGAAMRAHPLGPLSFHQHTAPLGLAMDKFGGADISGPSKLAITGISYGSTTLDPAAIGQIQDAFAPGQFLVLSDSDALSLPAFATYQAGVTFTPAAPNLDALATGDAVALGYALDLIDSQGQIPASPPAPMDAQAASRLVPSSPAARAPNRTTGASRYRGTTGTIAVNPRPPAGREAP